MAQLPDWAGPRALRLAMVASAAVALPLCAVHGVISHQLVPALGLLPLAASTGLAACCLFLTGRPEQAGTDDSVAATAAASLGIAALDTVLTIAMAAVVACTWSIEAQDSGMLAAYGTVPLLFSLLCHAFLAARGVHLGLALDRVAQWLAWRAVPADCPNCHYNLRPPVPSPPWVRGAAALGPRLSLALSPPAWWPHAGSYARLFVPTGGAADDEEDGRVGAYADGSLDGGLEDNDAESALRIARALERYRDRCSDQASERDALLDPNMEPNLVDVVRKGHARSTSIGGGDGATSWA